MTREQIVSAARQLIGTPYLHQGRVPGHGVDCVGVGVCVAWACGIKPTTWNITGYRRIPDGHSLMRHLRENMAVEVDLQGRLPGEIDLWLSWAWVEAEVSKQVIDAGTGLLIRPGDRLINIPEHRASLQLARTLRLAGREAMLGGAVQHSGERLGETGSAFELPAHTLVRLFARWSVTERVEVSAFLDNALDETWYANSYSRLWLQPGAPRTASVGLRYRF